MLIGNLEQTQRKGKRDEYRLSLIHILFYYQDRLSTAVHIAVIIVACSYHTIDGCLLYTSIANMNDADCIFGESGTYLAEMFKDGSQQSNAVNNLIPCSFSRNRTE